MKIDVSREAKEVLVRYQDLILKWNKAINLISKSSEEIIWQRHIIDSLQLCTYIDENDKVMDIGSGAGLPGIVLSIGGIKNITLVESDERKMAFLRQAIKLSTNKIDLFQEKITSTFEGECDILTCRGFASLKEILEITKNITIKKKILLLKGENYNQEITEAKKHWLFNVRVHDSITSGKGKVLEVFL